MDSPQILVVDDHSEIRFLLQAQLKKLGHTCDEAEDGMDAFERYQNHPYSLVLMDLAMPRLNGLEATKMIRDYEQTNDKERSVIIAVTGQGERSECLSAGMDDFTEKPILMDKLKVLLERWLPSN
ncbi:MAG: response regulator [Cyanobacteria bacterium SZAS-4]|nr:response regulator [Cyanobacteria bacterium SZAS-4]